MGIIEKIKEIEFEMARTQKNKATEYHLGQLKAKLAKLRTELQAPAKVSRSFEAPEGTCLPCGGDGTQLLHPFFLLGFLGPMFPRKHLSH